MRCIRYNLSHYVSDLGELVHKVDPVMETTCCVDNHDVSILCNSRLHCIECNRSRIRAHCLFDDIYPCTLCPDGKLINGSCTECICCTKHHLLALSLKTACELSDSRSLTYSVHSYYHDHVWLLTEIKRHDSIIRCLTVLYIKKLSYLIPEDIYKLVHRDILVSAHSLLKILDNLHCGVNTHISGQQSLLNCIKQIIIHLSLADNRP